MEAVIICYICYDHSLVSSIMSIVVVSCDDICVGTMWSLLYEVINLVFGGMTYMNA